MKKISILIVFIFFILISSVSASELNSTDSNSVSIDNCNDVVQLDDDTSDLNKLTDEIEIENKLSSNEYNESLSSSGSGIVNPGFEGSDGWDFAPNGGSISISSDVVNESSSSVCIKGNMGNMPLVSQSVDWTNIESFSFSFYGQGMFNMYILDHSKY